MTFARLIQRKKLFMRSTNFVGTNLFFLVLLGGRLIGMYLHGQPSYTLWGMSSQVDLPVYHSGYAMTCLVKNDGYAPLKPLKAALSKDAKWRCWCA